MKKVCTKISIFILISIFYCACNVLKRVPKSKKLLVKNEILVNGKKPSQEIIYELPYQKPNSKFLGIPLRLNFYNLARTNPDSIYRAKFAKNPDKYKRQSALLSAKQVERKGKSFLYSGIDNFLKRIGEPPVVFDINKTDKTILRLKSYYFNTGYFNATANYELDTINKRKAKIKYTVTTGNVWKIDSIKTKILTPALDSLYESSKKLSLLKKDLAYKSADLDGERNRITNFFRDNGAYEFQQNNIKFDIDTLETGHKTNIELVINNQKIKNGDSTTTKPFKLYKISKVNIFTDLPTDKLQTTIQDSASYKNFNLYSFKKLKYKPRALSDAV